MSKLVALAIAVTGSTSIVVGGSYLLNQGKGEGTGVGSSENPPKSATPDGQQEAQNPGTGGTESPSVTPKKELLFKSVEDFEQNWKTKPKCLTDSLFVNGISEDDKSSSAPELQTGNQPSDGTFFATSTDGSNPYKSCLIIDGRREDYSVDKWKGAFTGTGTFVKGNEGFVNFNIAETSSSETNKLQFKGVFYLLGKGTGENDKWEVKHKKVVKDNPKKVEAADLDSYFPKRGTGVTNGKDDYGGFFKNTTSGQQLQHICGDSDCKPELRKPIVDGIELHWEGSNTSSADSKKLKDGSNNLTWGSSIYDSSSWNLENKIENFSGTGKEITAASPSSVTQGTQ